MSAQFVDYFVLCGLDSRSLDKEGTSSSSSLYTHMPPLSSTYTPSILAHFPDSRKDLPFDEGAIQTLCLPDGIQLCKNLKQTTHKSFHSFLVTREDGSHTYGTVLVFYEQISDQKLLNSLEILQSRYQDTPRRAVMFNSDHEDYFNREEDGLYALKCVCLVTSQPIHRPCRAFLEQLYAVTAGNHTAPLSIESYLFNLLYEVNLPEPGKFLRISGPLGKISWYMSPRFELPLCDYSFREFFEMLGIQDILRVLACVLMEHQLLLKSSDYHKLMLGANCLAALLFPFSWPHVFVPILPSSQRGFLDAPVPYIMGLRVQSSTNTTRLLSIANESSLCSVDLDNRKVETLDGLPDLPNSDTLISQLSEKVKEFSVNCPDVRDLPLSPKTKPSMSRVADALRIVNELARANTGTDQQRLLTDLSDQARGNPLIPNLLNIAKRAGVSGLEDGAVTDLAGLVTLSSDEEEEEEEEEEDSTEKNDWDYSPNKKDQRFSAAVRNVFSSYFVEHFANYDNFIIVPTQTYDQWIQNREQFQNFDKTAFLSDQPTHHWPFYSAFLESSMFSAFIDEKVTSLWMPEKASERLVSFDSRVEAYRDKSGLAKPPTTPGLGSRSSSFVSTGGVSAFLQLHSTEEETEEVDDDTLNDDVIAESIPLPRQLPGEGRSVLVAMRNKTRKTGVFPELDSALLKPKPVCPGSKIENGQSQGGRTTLTIPRPSSAGLLPRTMNTSIKSPSPTIFSRRTKGRPRGNPTLVGGAVGGVSAGFSSHSHAKFVNQLMRESRFRVKHMMGSSPDSHSSIEENTHIGCLCDLLERIWGHGLKKRDSKSPLWAHLTAYVESSEMEDISCVSPPPSHPPSPPLLSSSMSSLSMLSSSPSASTGAGDSPSLRSVRGIINTQFRRRRFGSPLLRSQIENILQPPPSSLLADFLIVRNMRELKTDVGHARAFVRLALEKRSLSRHLTTLLSRDDLTSQRYREYAFLRTEEEREQFIYHLLTLTAKDFSCFTNGFVGSTMVYKVLLVGEGKRFGLSTSTPYITLAGYLGDTGVIEIPRGDNHVEITHQNIGPLTCLRVGHDNSGIAPSLLLEMVLVHNKTTGQIYRFNCGQWLSRSADDGSLERFLVCEKVPQTIRNSVNIAALGVDGVLPSPSNSRRRNTNNISNTNGGRRESTGNVSEVQQLKANLRLVLEKIRTAVQSKNIQNTNQVQELLCLMHGEEGYIETMEKILLLGFKSSRKFGKRLFLWDLIERVCEYMCASEAPTPLVKTAPHPAMVDRQLLLKMVERINSNYIYSGKCEKMALFLSIGVRDHHIATWLSLIAQCTPILSSLYEPCAFLCDHNHLHFLIYTLSSLSSISSSVTLRLEPLFTQSL